MTKELTVKNNQLAILEKVLIKGDLSSLTSDERVNYYNEVCKTVGLNPLTKPFEYINLQGKLTLYATRACTEQLRKIYGVSITGIETQQLSDIYIVKAFAKDKAGKVDVASGALTLKGLSGEKLANAIMKAETKAKRRVTLSICGLGMLDETEVEDTIDAKPVDAPTYTEKLAIAEKEEKAKQEAFQEQDKLQKAIDDGDAYVYDLSRIKKEDKAGIFKAIIANNGKVIDKKAYSLMPIKEIENYNFILELEEVSDTKGEV